MNRSKPVVIVTQSRMGSAGSGDFTIEHAPVIRTELLPFDEDVLDGEYDWLILTSPNSVEHFAPLLGRVKFNRLASIGKRTSETMAEHGMHVDFEPSGYTQEKFMEEFAVKKGERILYPVSANARPLMYEYLSGAGAEVTRIRLYHPVPDEESLAKIERLLEEGAYAVTFSSPSGVEAFAGKMSRDILENVVVAAIGHVTHDALKKKGNRQYPAGKRDTAGYVRHA
ncbi:uroporphyrinogen-III synthase [Salinicoccus sediminis]|uniref:uroporphyrinogen-III synthase n=1 Tax=Salinicoccus sediminis TaxID=1432562 RepID=UPI001E3E35A3|nr:uroporphyrinogen-III synthase [Salinicoccus sediminis]